MIVAALTFSACLAVVLFVFGTCFALVARHWYESERLRLRQELEAALRSFIESPDGTTQSPLGVMLDSGATLLAARLVNQIKAMLMGVESGLAKRDNADSLAAGAAGQSPWLALITGMLPTRVRNGLLKNPTILSALSHVGGNHGSTDSTAAVVRKHRN